MLTSRSLAGFDPTLRASIAQWQSTLDAAFGQLEAVKFRETLLEPYIQLPTQTRVIRRTLLKKFGFWTVLNVLVACTKLGRISLTTNLTLRQECIEFGRSLCRTLLEGMKDEEKDEKGIPLKGKRLHPVQDREYAYYEMSELLAPGASEATLTSESQERPSIEEVVDAIEFVGSNLVTYSHRPIESLPIFTLYEWFGRIVLKSIFHTTNARLWKCRACIEAGMLTPAAHIYIQLMEGLQLPEKEEEKKTTSPSEVESIRPITPLDGKKGKRKQDTARNGTSTGGKTSRGDKKDKDNVDIPPEIPPTIPPFYDHYPPTHSINRGFVQYLLGETFPASHLNSSPVALLYGGYLWHELRLLRATFLTVIGTPRSQLAPELELPDDGLTPKAPVQPVKEKRRKSRPDTDRPTQSTRPGSSGPPNDGAAVSPNNASSLFESLALRTDWLRAAERIHLETIALFVPIDPSEPRDAFGRVVPAVTSLPPLTSPKRGGSRKAAGSSTGVAGGASPSGSGGAEEGSTVPPTRRRSAQGFAELFGRASVVAALNPPPAQPATTKDRDKDKDKDPNAPPPVPPPTFNEELLTSISRGHVVHPVTLVTHAYARMGELRDLQGLQSDATYFRKRALKVMKENMMTTTTATSNNEEEKTPTPTMTTTASLSNTTQVTADGDAASRSATPTTSTILPPITPSPAPAPAPAPATPTRRPKTNTTPSPKTSSRRVGGKDKAPAPVAPVDRPPSAGVPVVVIPPPFLGPYGLVVVPHGPTVSPLHWRQLLDPRVWLRVRVDLARSLFGIGRSAEAASELEQVRKEAETLYELNIQHEAAHLSARILMAQGSFLDAFKVIRKGVWKEKTYEELEARRLLLARTPGGEKALPPPMPRPRTYDSDYGSGLLTLLHLFRRCPSKDASDMDHAKGEVHSEWIFQILERQVLENLQRFGIKPTDLQFAANNSNDIELKRRTLESSTLQHKKPTMPPPPSVTNDAPATTTEPVSTAPSAGVLPPLLANLPVRSLQTLFELHYRPGVVSKYVPFISTAIETLCLRSKDLLAKGRTQHALQRAILAEAMLVLMPTRNPVLEAEVAFLVGQVAWRVWREAAQHQHQQHQPIDLCLGLTDRERIELDSASHVPSSSTPPPSNVVSTPNGKKSSRGTSPSSSSASSPTSQTSSTSNTPRTNRNNENAEATKEQQEEKENGDGKEKEKEKDKPSKDRSSNKKKSSQSKAAALAEQAALAEAALAAEQLAQSEARAAAARAAADETRRIQAVHAALNAEVWTNGSLDQLPQQIEQQRTPKSLLDIIRRLHKALKLFLMHGANHMRVKAVSAVLVDLHSTCFSYTSPSPSSLPLIVPSRLHLSSPVFHSTFVSWWTFFASKICSSDFQQLRTGIHQLGQMKLKLTSEDGNGATNIPPYITTELNDAQRFRQRRKQEEIAFLTSKYTDPVLVKERDELPLLATTGTGGTGSTKESRKDRDKDKHGVSATIPSLSTGVSGRTLLLYGQSLHSDLSARMFESEVGAAMSKEQIVSLDIEQILKTCLGGYNEMVHSVQWNGVMNEITSFAAADGDAYDSPSGPPPSSTGSLALAAAHSALSTSLTPGSLSTLWFKRDADIIGATTDAESLKQPITLVATISTNIERGAAGVHSHEPSSAKGRKSGAPVSSSSSSSKKNVVSGAAPPAGGSSRKKKSSTLASASDASLETELPVHPLYGRNIPPPQVNIVIRVVKEAIMAMAAQAATLRHTLMARTNTSEVATAAATVELQPIEKLAFIQLVLDLHSTFGGVRGALLSSIGVDPSAPVTLSNLPLLVDSFSRAYGLQPTLAEVDAIERLLDFSAENGGSALIQSNGLPLLLLEAFGSIAIIKTNVATPNGQATTNTNASHHQR